MRCHSAAAAAGRWAADTESCQCAPEYPGWRPVGRRAGAGRQLCRAVGWGMAAGMGRRPAGRG